MDQKLFGMNGKFPAGMALALLLCLSFALAPVGAAPEDERWSPLGSGMGGQYFDVSALALDADGNLYAGGGFTTAGGFAANRIAKWDGSSWSPLGSGVNGVVHALAFDASGNLFAGGYFTTAGGVPANYIAKWDGVSWSPLGSGVNGEVDALAFDASGNLFAGGYFTTAGGVSANGIAKWDGASWSPLGSGMAATGISSGYHLVSALAFDGSGDLYAGGVFTSAGGVPANYIAKWDGSSWSPLGSGMALSLIGYSQVFALAFDYGGNLYAGGWFTSAGGVSANYIAKWDGSAWSALGSGMGDVHPIEDFPLPGVGAIALDGSGNLYAGGRFRTAGGIAAKNVAKWDGSSWSTLGSGMEMVGGNWPEVNALALDGSGSLFVGGYFNLAGGKPSPYIAKWDTGSSILGAVTKNGAPLAGVVVNLTGAAVRTATTGANGTYRFADLPNGSYTITPSSGQYVFDPASRSVSYGGEPLAGQDFAATRVYSLSGSVKKGNAPVAGVAMRLSGAAAKTVSTGADGTYRFIGLQDGVYTVTPGRNLYTFAPVSRSLNVNGSDLGGQDFAAARQTGQPTVTISASTPNATEAGAKGAFKVTRSWSTSSPLTVKYTVGGSATSGTDYNALPGEVVIAANTLSAIIQVIPVNDAEIEGDETVTATLSTDPSYTVGSPNSATVKIADNDAVVTITALVPTATEWGTKGSFRVTRTGPTTSGLAVKYTLSGTATNGSDYNTLSGAVTIPAGKSFTNIAVTPVEDAGVEGMETVTATLSADPHYTVGSPDSATIKIVDNDVVVTITALFPNAKESGTKGLFQVIRTGPTTTGLAVKYTVGGTATNGTDYGNLSGSVTIQAGKSFANIAVIPVNDTVHEGMETVVATLSANPYYIVGSPNSATVEIADND